MKNTAKLYTNEILEEGNIVISNNWLGTIVMKDYVKNVVLSDYAKGIRKASVTIIPSDYGSEAYPNNKVINWNENGETIKVGNFVKVLGKDNTSFIKDSSNNDIYFRVIGCKIRYDGQILMDLELEEIKLVEVV